MRGTDYLAGTHRVSQEGVIGCAEHANVGHVNGVVPTMAKYGRDLGRQVGVDQQPHRLCRPRERKLALLNSIRCELKRRQDVGPL